MIINGSLGGLNREEIESAIIHEIYKSTIWGSVGFLVLPIARALFFALWVYIFSRLNKASHHHHGNGHIFSALVLEEALKFSLERFLNFPVISMQRYYEYRADKTVRDLKLGESYAVFLLHSVLHAHNEMANPTRFFRLFNNCTNLFERIKYLIGVEDYTYVF